MAVYREGRLQMQAEGMSGFALSPQQKFIWQQSLHGAAGTVSGTVSVAGPLDINLLERSLFDSIERHEILRTRFRTPAGMAVPLQVIGEAASSAEIVRYDLAPLTEANRAERLAQVSVEVAALPFDPQTGPVIRLAIVSIRP